MNMKIILKKAIFPVTLASLFALSAQAIAYQKTGSAEVKFIAKGPAGLEIVGKGSELNVKESGDTVTVVVPLGKIDTGIELRNKHMREKYLETGKFPNAELVVKKGDIKVPSSGGTMDGNLTIRGKTKAVKVKYSASDKGGNIAVEGSMNIRFTDFGIEEPSFMGASVKPDIQIAANFSVKP